MSELDKALARLRARPPLADFADVRKVLEAYGWTQDRQKGSHVMFVKRGRRAFAVPLVRGRSVRRIYIDQLFELLDEDG